MHWFNFKPAFDRNKDKDKPKLKIKINMGRRSSHPRCIGLISSRPLIQLKIKIEIKIKDKDKDGQEELTS